MLSNNILFTFSSTFSIIIALLGVVLYVQHPKGRLNSAFLFSSLSVSLWALVMALSIFIPFKSHWLFLARASMPLAILTSYSFLIISKKFLKNKIFDKHLVLLTVACFLVAVQMMTPYGFDSITIKDNFPFANATPWLMSFTLIQIFLLFSIIRNLLLRIKQTDDLLLVQHAKMFLASYVVVHFLLFTTVLIPVQFLGSKGLVAVSPFFYVIVLFVSAYAVVQFRFLDTKVSFVKVRAFAAAVTVFALTYLLGYYCITRISPNIDILVILLVLIVLFFPTYISCFAIYKWLENRLMTDTQRKREAIRLRAQRIRLVQVRTGHGKNDNQYSEVFI